MKLNKNDIKEFLDESYLKYNNKQFIENDPICIPHRFTKKEDIEIAGLLASTIAWGNRKSIINNACKLMQWMDNEPYGFVTSCSKKELKPFESFVHRTFNGKDCVFFIEALRNIYTNHGGLENAFRSTTHTSPNFPLKEKIIHFRNLFFETKHLRRSEKHVSNPAAKSSAKRLCMYKRVIRTVKKRLSYN